MKTIVLSFLAGYVLAGVLCVVVRTSEGSAQRIMAPPTLVQYREEEPGDNEAAWLYRFRGDFSLPPLPRFKPSPPLYNWQLPCQ